MQPLPIDDVLPEVVRTAKEARALVLAAPPGSGKTTRVPGALIDAGLDGQVLVLEPRRLAARAAARRVASERGAKLGGAVGYHVRHDRRIGDDTRIAFLTDGVLLRRLVNDPFLEGVGAVILDEFHERRMETDLALAMLAEVRATVRDDLRIAVMSATLDVDPIAAFLDAPVLRAEGRAFPVEVTWSERVESGPLAPRVRAALDIVLAETEGDVLVFLPGTGEIAATKARVADLVARHGADCVALHGGLDPKEQDRAIRPGPRRKVVLATNVAESSITIEGVTAVIDSGEARVLRHDPARGLEALRIERISLASAEQRRGRAGRTAPGRCHRLWARAEERGMAAFDTPEVRRIDLAGPALQVRAFAGRDPATFGWFEAPERAALERADALLRRLSAIDPDGRVTDTGRRLLRHPLHPRLGRMLDHAEREGCVAATADVAALLSERDIERRGEGATGTGSLLELAARWRHAVDDGIDDRACRAQDLDPRAVRAVAAARRQIGGRGGRDRRGDDAVRRAVLAGFPDRVIVRDGEAATTGRMVGGRGVALVGEHEHAGLLVAVEAREPGGRDRSRSLVTRACAIDRAWLADVVPGSVTEETVTELDEARGAVYAIRRTRYLDLVLGESRGGDPDANAAEELLTAFVSRDPWRHLGEQRDLRRFLARVAWLRETAPDLEVPTLDDDAIAAAARGFLAGHRNVRPLMNAKILPVLRAQLTRDQQRLLDRHAPAALDLPSGRKAVIDYAAEGPPFVAGRMQEFFGTASLPTLAGGRVPLVAHLLAPNQRPVQITADLPSFWQNVYPKVRSELRRRYPKHAWPEDPLTAQAEARPRRRRRDS